MDLRRRPLEILLDRVEAEGVGVALVPVGRPAEAVEMEARVAGRLAPVGPLAEAEPAHQPPCE